MLTLSCPSCGANVDFRSKASVYAVCSYCKASLVRHDIDLEKIGVMADLQDDLTPIQIGTTGMYQKEKFEVIGRMRIAYSDGFWNEWYAMLGDGRIAWLAEAQGFYAFCMPYFEGKIPGLEAIRVGKTVDFGPKGIYEVDDKRMVTVLYSEGELPSAAAKGRESTSVDLSGFDKEMATIEYAKDNTRVFLGHYLDFDEYQFKNLRRLDGW